MPRENVEVVRKSWEAFVRGEFEAALEPIAADVKFDLTNQPDGQVFVGHDGLWRALRKWMAAWDDYEMKLEDLIDAGDEVFSRARPRPPGGAPIEATSAAVWTFATGKSSTCDRSRTATMPSKPWGCGSRK